MIKKLFLLLFGAKGLSTSARMAEDLFNKGVESHKAGDYVNAVKYYKQAAEQGYAKAQCNLGMCYYYGRGVAQDNTEAVKWYRLAAKHGYAEAQYSLGLCYLNGTGVAQNYTEAVKWLKKAAKQGNASAINVLKHLGIQQ